MRTHIFMLALCLLVVGTAFADAPPGPYSDDFETVLTGTDAWGADGWNDYLSYADRNGPWSNLSRVEASLAGIPVTAANDGWLGTFDRGGPFSRLGGYDATWPAGGLEESIDVFFPNEATWGTQLEYTMSMSRATGDHLRDYVIHMRRNDDGNGFDVWASNNSSYTDADLVSYINKPTSEAVNVQGNAWYTLNSRWYISDGSLAADLSIIGDQGTIGTWTRHNENDLVGLVGGSRYGWFPWNSWGTVYMDNVYRSGSAAPSTDESPEPATWLLLACTGVAAVIRRRRAA